MYALDAFTPVAYPPKFKKKNFLKEIIYESICYVKNKEKQHSNSNIINMEYSIETC